MKISLCHIISSLHQWHNWLRPSLQFIMRTKKIYFDLLSAPLLTCRMQRVGGPPSSTERCCCCCWKNHYLFKLSLQYLHILQRLTRRTSDDISKILTDFLVPWHRSHQIYSYPVASAQKRFSEEMESLSGKREAESDYANYHQMPLPHCNHTSAANMTEKKNCPRRRKNAREEKYCPRRKKLPEKKKMPKEIKIAQDKKCLRKKTTKRWCCPCNHTSAANIRKLVRFIQKVLQKKR